MAGKRTRKRKTTRKRMPGMKKEGVALIISILLVLAFFQYGWIGENVHALIQIFIGELASVAEVLGIVGSLYLVFTGSYPNLWNRFGISIANGLPLLALFLHAMDYKSIAAVSPSAIFPRTLQTVLQGFQGNFNLNVGGGLLGSLLYQLTYLAVSQVGTIFILLGWLSWLLMYLFQISLNQVVTTLQFIGKIFMDWLDDFMAQAKAFKEDRQQLQQEKERLMEEERLNSKTTDIPIQEPQEAEETKEEINEEVPIVSPYDYPKPTKDEQASQENLPIDLDVETEEDSDSDLSDLKMEAEVENPDYHLPGEDLLDPIPVADQSGEYQVIQRNIKRLEKTFTSFNVNAKVTKANLGPAVTKYEIQPAVGTKVSKITNLADDIALSLAAKDIRIEAPIPGKSVIGIEVPNQQTSLVSFADVFKHQPKNSSILEVPLGRDISGNVHDADLTQMPHLLIAGSTGSGKSVAINSIIVSLLMKAKPHEVKLMMVDPKKVELAVYNGIPHLLTPVVTNPKKAAAALNKVVEEMERRYELFALTGQRNIDGYNRFIREKNLEEGENQPILPFIVVVVDELADLMMVASKEVEAAITRLAQMARAAGIHMILATQRPSVDVITGIIKANIPSRIAFAVSSGTDSRTIIDQNGAEKLLGRGDMLYMPMGESKPVRIQGAFITDQEVERVVDFVKGQQEVHYVEEMIPSSTSEVSQDDELDEIWDEVMAFVKTRETISISMLQRQFRIGYNRAARIVDDMEKRHLVGPQVGGKPRQVILKEESQEDKEKENEFTE